MNAIRKKNTWASIALILGLVCFFIIGPIVSKPKFYFRTIQSLDEKKITIAEITAGTAVASVVIGAVPDDATSPIANQVVELSSKLLLVSGIVVLEKALLPITGTLAFRIMLPIASVFLSIYFIKKKNVFLKCCVHFLLFGLLIFSIVPASVIISDQIAETLQANAAIDKVMELTEEIDGDSENEKSGIVDYISSLGKKVASGVSGAVEKFETVISNLIDMISILIICYCVIPVVVMIIIVGIIKLLLKQVLTVFDWNH